MKIYKKANLITGNKWKTSEWIIFWQQYFSTQQQFVAKNMIKKTSSKTYITVWQFDGFDKSIIKIHL